MTAKATRNRFSQTIVPWLDFLALAAWGALLIELWLTGELRLLIHPNYSSLVLGTGIVLLLMGGFKLLERFKPRRTSDSQTVQHLTIFPPGVSTFLLLVAAIAGLLIPPKILASETALQRGVSAALPLTQTQTRTFRAAVKPEDRTIVDWVRTLNTYPEPDAYKDQPVKISGFVVQPADLPENYIYLCRFIITCCAVDASPVGLPIKLPQARDKYPPDRWLELKGKIIPEVLAGKRQVVVAVDSADAIAEIPTPKDPYEFNN
ncbi:TIGR03943 family protein [Oscillatoria sp. FACHB-1406]|uniref:TIGR03943 family putative permease subunit n=1 Tax=Oscillatoria sp. FACHB-1406 TaxID=2692846 RepID=UPI001689C986|nr:TIGR03943 family protein [Oscillatoria sp. FACHB-1406]MBD2576371.1 TIGR03943 family protein [Oscillatoria sp. FACHB-1406]